MADKAQSSDIRRASQERQIKSERHDAEFFKERKKQEALNLEKTLRLRALRQAKEAEARAAAPAPAPSKSRARTSRT